MPRLCFATRSMRRRGTLCVLLFLTIIVIFRHLPDTPNHKLEEEEQKMLEQRKYRKQIDVNSWVLNPTVRCNKHFIGYNEEFVWLRNARLNSNSRIFSIPCEEHLPKYEFQHGFEGTPLQEWYDQMDTFPFEKEKLQRRLKIHETTTFVVMRNEAHNLYHTMCEWYNVFLLSKLLDFNASKVDILLLDDRPSSPMDEGCQALFKDIMKYTEVDNNVVFRNLLWNVIGYESPMNFHFQHRLPYLRQFREYFLNSFNLVDTKTLDCRRLTVTLVVRRDYMTHPERLNMTGGLVHRKFKNENEIIREINVMFKNHVINIVILENLSLKEQLETITHTDVLIGMHGAGMSHILFLPRHAVVFEMFPKYWGFYHHFKAMARWRDIKYIGWQNTSPENEFPDFFTRIPIEIFRTHCQTLKSFICGT